MKKDFFFIHTFFIVLFYFYYLIYSNLIVAIFFAMIKNFLEVSIYIGHLAWVVKLLYGWIVVFGAHKISPGLMPNDVRSHFVQQC